MSFFRQHILFKPSKFLPNKAPNLGLWLESDWGVTKDGGNATNAWLDRSLNAYNFTQAVGANQPIWTAGEFGGNAGIIFDGVNDSLEISVSNPFSTTQNFSFFAVHKSLVNDNDQNYFGMGDLGSSDLFLLAKGDNTNIRTNGVRVATVLTGTLNEVAGGTSLNDNLAKLITIESNGSAWSARLRGVSETLTVVTGGGSNSGNAPGDFITLDNITIGMFRRSGIGFARSNFAAILFYTSQISAADRTNVENYLINKYAI